MIQGDVGDRSDTAIPGVCRVEPAAQPDLDEGDVDPGFGELAEHERREQLELRRLAMAPCDAVGDSQDGVDVPREVVDADRVAVDGDALAIRHQVRLRRFADTETGGTQRAAGQGEDAALAVGPGHEGTAHGQMRVAERRQQCPCPPEPEPDPEPTARRERGEGLVIGGRRGRGGHSRVSSSS